MSSMKVDAHDSVTSFENKDRFVAPWADGDHLRIVEKDVIIPKLMKQKAMVLCKEYVDSFVDCSKGRTVSMVWSCRSAANAMRKCLETHCNDDELRKACTEEYLQKRSEFQHEYVETGNKTKRR